MTATTAALQQLGRARFTMSNDISAAFFEREIDRIAAASRDLARAFSAGGRLLVFGSGSSASDALHVAVEFVHPVTVGKRALPAVAFTTDLQANVGAHAQPRDIAFGIAACDDGALRGALSAARARGVATIALIGASTDGWEADHVFAVGSGDAHVVQEVQETLYHVLWETVHVFLDTSEMPS